MFEIISYIAFFCFIYKIYIEIYKLNQAQAKFFVDGIYFTLIIQIIIYILEFVEILNHQFILITFIIYVFLKYLDIKNSKIIDTMKCPNYPHEISRDSIIEYAKLVFTQLDKFAGKSIRECFEKRDQCKNYDFQNKNIIADQGDALVDIDYYSRNIAGLYGIDLSKKFYEKYDIKYYDENNILIKDDDINFSEYVKKFTEESKEIICPDFPQNIPQDKVIFLTKMIMSELDELICTISNNEDDKNNIMDHIFNSYLPEFENIDQIDSLVTIYYLSKNLAYSHGINLSKIFHEVHTANLNKRDPVSKKYIIRKSDGKILKPTNWKEPDIVSVIQKQIDFGSWN